MWFDGDHFVLDSEEWEKFLSEMEGDWTDSIHGEQVVRELFEPVGGDDVE
jgi:hypothetical protein